MVLDADTVALLKAHRAQQHSDRLRAGPECHDTDLVLSGQTGQPLDARNVLDWFQRMTVDAGLGAATR